MWPRTGFIWPRKWRSERSKKHFKEVFDAKEGQRIVEANLANIEHCTKQDQEDFQGKKDKWATERADLIKAKEEAVLAQLVAERKTSEAQKQVVKLMARLAEDEKLARTEEEWCNSWRESKACEVFSNQVGSAAQKMGEEEALERMKKALAKSHPTFAWDEAMASYIVLADAEDAAIVVELNIRLSDEESGEAEEEDP